MASVDFSNAFSMFPAESFGFTSPGVTSVASPAEVAKPQEAAPSFNISDLVSLGKDAIGGVSNAAGALGDFAQNTLGDFFNRAGSLARQGAAKQEALAGNNLGLGTGLLGNGNAGPEVKALQEQLRAQGAEIEADGIFGPKTEAALKDFQAKQAENGGQAIAVDGVAGPETRAALGRAAEAAKEKDAANRDAVAEKKDADLSPDAAKKAGRESIEATKDKDMDPSAGKAAGKAADGSYKEAGDPSKAADSKSKSESKSESKGESKTA